MAGSGHKKGADEVAGLEFCAKCWNPPAEPAGNTLRSVRGERARMQPEDGRADNGAVRRGISPVKFKGHVVAA